MKRSRILSEVHEAAKAMHRSGTIDKRKMREFDALAQSRVLDPSAKQIRMRGVTKPRTAIRKATAPIPRQDLEAFAEIYVRVAEFFQNTSKTTAWFRAANPMLGGMRPIEMLLSGRAHRLLRFVKQTDATRRSPPINAEKTVAGVDAGDRSARGRHRFLSGPDDSLDQGESTAAPQVQGTCWPVRPPACLLYREAIHW
jgi:uncharacterized protein (DUF2384 family)